MGESSDDVTIAALTADHRVPSRARRQHSINAIVLAYWISAIVDNITRWGAKVVPNYLEDTAKSGLTNDLEGLAGSVIASPFDPVYLPKLYVRR